MDMQNIRLKSAPTANHSVSTLLSTCLDVAETYLNSGKRTHAVGPLRPGEHLYRASQPANEMFIVQSGCFKIYAYDKAGREYIHGFRLRGSILGLHGLYGRNHPFNAMALSRSTAYKLPLPEIAELGTRAPEFVNALLRLIGREIIDNVFLSGNFTAEERVAAFLVSFSRKLESSEHQIQQVALPMSRGDIAVYLRLTLPTVSRIMSRLKHDGVIRSDYHHIEIADPVRLEKLCRNVPMPEQQEPHVANINAS